MLTAMAFGLSLPDLAVGAIALGYVVSLVKDWRPIRTLRAENRELRALCEASDRKNAESEKKISALEAQVHVLEKATNLTALQEEQRHIAETLERVADKLQHLDGAVRAIDGTVRANTAAVELIASGSAIRQTIEDMKSPDREAA